MGSMKLSTVIVVTLMLVFSYIMGYWNAIVTPTVAPMAPSEHDQLKQLDRGCDDIIKREGRLVCEVEMGVDDKVYIIKVNEEN